VSELLLFNEWVSYYYLMPNDQFFSYILTRTSFIQWNDCDVHFVLGQHAELDFYSACSLKQQSTGRHVAPLEHIILILSQQDPIVMFLDNKICLS
jgi:hypothetical protein